MMLRARRLLTRITRTRRAEPPPATAARRTPGLVEEFTRRRIVGWVSVPAGAPPTRVTLQVGQLDLAATYASPGVPLSGSQGGPPSAPSRPHRAPAARGRRLPGPPGDHRNSAQEVRAFSFRIKGIWPFLKKRNRIRVTVDGQALPIAGHGMFVHPPRNGEQSLSELRALFDAGHLLSQSGTIRLSKKLDTEWQQRVMRLYQKVRTIVPTPTATTSSSSTARCSARSGKAGTSATTSTSTRRTSPATRTGREAAAELVDIAHTLIDAGLVVDARERLLHINDPDDPEDRIDLFHTYVDPDGHVQFPWGVAGTGRPRRARGRGGPGARLPRGQRPGPGAAPRRSWRTCTARTGGSRNPAGTGTSPAPMPPSTGC